MLLLLILCFDIVVFFHKLQTLFGNTTGNCKNSDYCKSMLTIMMRIPILNITNNKIAWYFKPYKIWCDFLYRGKQFFLCKFGHYLSIKMDTLGVTFSCYFSFKYLTIFCFLFDKNRILRWYQETILLSIYI